MQATTTAGNPNTDLRDALGVDELSLSIWGGFSLQHFEEDLPRFNGDIVRRTSSTDELMHVVTYVRNTTPDQEEATLLFTTRLFKEGVSPATNTPDDDFTSKDQALFIHADLVEAFLSVYEAAPCLLEGAL
jgi:hypothetical protein